VDELRRAHGRARLPHRRAHARRVGEEPPEGYLGDLALCPQSPRGRRPEHHHGPDDEIDLLCVHGILHLLGYDHGDPDEHREMFGLQTRLLAEWQGVREGPAAAGPGPGRGPRVTFTDTWLLTVAVLLVLVAGVTASAEAALASFSKARAGELLGQGRRGANRLLEISDDAPRYLNTVLLLRKAAETTAVVLVALVVADAFPNWWQRILVAAGTMVVVSYVFVGVAPRTLGRQHAERVALSLSGPVVALTRVAGPLPRLLILLGNALTPARGSPRARSSPRQSCASWSTSPSRAR
jgi:rRNA maturation RNase YbeY